MVNCKKPCDIDFTVYFQACGINFQTEEMSLPSDNSINEFCKHILGMIGTNNVSWMYWTNNSKIKTFIHGSKLYFQECDWMGTLDLGDFDLIQEDSNNG